LDNLVRELLGEPLLDDEARDAVPAPTPTTTLLRVTSTPLGLDPVDVEIDLDIEYDEQQRVYLWGCLISHPAASGAARYVHVGSASGDMDESQLAAEFLAKVEDLIASATRQHQTVRVYHYGAVERLFMERLLGQKSASVVAIATDLLAVVREHFFSASGYALKELAPLAGAAWRTAGLDGRTAQEWVEKARAGDEQAWTQLVRYNVDDVRANRALREFLRGRESEAW
jgi:predicted RecB family nuclease